MRTVVEQIDVAGGATLDMRLCLLLRESVRRHRDRSLTTRILSLLDTALGMGYWWFPTFEYACYNPDGSLYRRSQVRHTLAGYTVAWGRHVEYYDDGTKANEGLIWQAAFSHKCTMRQYKYWLPDGTKVSQSVWMHEMFGPEVDGCHDLTWEK